MISKQKYSVGSWNPSSWKTRTAYLYSAIATWRCREPGHQQSWNDIFLSEYSDLCSRMVKKSVRRWNTVYIDGLVQQCSNFLANALQFLQFCTKPSILKYLVQTHQTFPCSWLSHNKVRSLYSTTLVVLYKLINIRPSTANNRNSNMVHMFSIWPNTKHDQP